jgi:cysteine-rich repeat protein
MITKRISFFHSPACGASVVAAAVCLAGSAAMALSQGPNSPGTAVNDSSVGIAAWSFTDQVAASDDSNAIASVPSQYLKATDFGFSLPPTAAVEGITVTVEKSSAAGTVFDASVRIVKGGTVTGTDHKEPPANVWPTTDVVVSYGGSSDLWGETWTAADVNAAGFGVAVAAGDSFDTAAIDHITITLTYSLCGDGIVEGSEDCDDGNTNDGDCCSSTCQFEPSGSPCESDGNVCTDDECDGAGTCEHNNNTAPCDDGDPCTSNDQCSGGVCAGTGFCLNGFKCYQGKDLKDPKFNKIDSVNTSDQLHPNQSVGVKKVKFVCNAASVDGAGVEDPDAALVCYLTKADNLSPRPSVEVSTQFQVSRFQAKKGKLLCLPSTLTPLP